MQGHPRRQREEHPDQEEREDEHEPRVDQLIQHTQLPPAFGSAPRPAASALNDPDPPLAALLQIFHDHQGAGIADQHQHRDDDGNFESFADHPFALLRFRGGLNMPDFRRFWRVISVPIMGQASDAPGNCKAEQCDAYEP